MIFCSCLSASDQFLLVAGRNNLREISLETEYFAQKFLPVSGVERATAAVVDPVESNWNKTLLSNVTTL